MELVPLPPSFASTRDALHALAEHVLAPARHRVTGRIGLRALPGGFGTPPFDDQQVRVDGVELVHRRGDDERRAPITTIRAAAELVGIEPGAPGDVYTPATAGDPDRVLRCDAAAAAALAGWYAFADALLHDLREKYADASPSETQLWPEHFDLACDIGDADAGTRANYGASPGDGTISEPYLYVGPWDAARRTGVLGTHPWGAGITYAELRAAADPHGAARTFFADSATLLLGR